MKNNLFIIFTFVAAAFLLSCTMSSSGSSGDSGSSNSTGGGSSESGGSGSGSGGTTINYYANYATLPPAEISASLTGTARTEYLTSLFSGLTGDSTVTLTGNLSEEDLSTIAGCISARGYEYNINLDLSGVNNLTEIPDNAFKDCEKLTGITLPASVTTIGDFAFDDCENLASITLPDSVETIGDFAFSCCGIDQISIPDSIETIGYGAFDACAHLTSIEVSDSNPNYSSEDGVLYDKDKETLFCFPGGKTGSYTIPESVTYICETALAYSGNLSELTIPVSITADNFESPLDFSLCENLTSINVASPNPDFSSIDGVLFNSNKTTLIWYPAGKTESSYEIPDSVTNIGFAAFSGCKNLTTISIQGPVTTIENSAFQYCTGLQSIEIPDSVETIGYGAFADCSNLTSITIPASVNRIDARVFEECENLNSVIFEDTTTWYATPTPTGTRNEIDVTNSEHNANELKQIGLSNWGAKYLYKS